MCGDTWIKSGGPFSPLNSAFCGLYRNKNILLAGQATVIVGGMVWWTMYSDGGDSFSNFSHHIKIRYATIIIWYWSDLVFCFIDEYYFVQLQPAFGRIVGQMLNELRLDDWALKIGKGTLHHKLAID